jgi:hypothetical protein
MAISLVIEEDHGTYVGTPRHPHNGYYAGDFTSRSPRPDRSDLAPKSHGTACKALALS